MTTLPVTRSEPEIGTPSPPALIPSFAPDDVTQVGSNGTATAVADHPQATASAERVAFGEKEPWAPWRVRLTYVAAFCVVGVPIFALMSWLWDSSDPSHGLSDHVVDAISFIWILLALPVVLNVVGALTFRKGSAPRPTRRPSPTRCASGWSLAGPTSRPWSSRSPRCEPPWTKHRCSPTRWSW